MARPRRLTPKKDWGEAFLTVMSRTGNVLRSCEAAGITRQAAYARRDKDTAFADAWGAAVDDAADVLEEVARERATGQSDVLLMFLLKGIKPDKYRERFSQEISGPAGGPVAIREVVVELPRGESE